MTAAVFGVVGVVVGGVLSAVTAWLLQRSQDRRRWAREDAQKFEPERLALYRDFLNGIELAASPGEKLDENGLFSMLSEMELLSSSSVYAAAISLLNYATSMEDDRGEREEHDPHDDGVESYGELKKRQERFNLAVREELGVTTAWDLGRGRGP